MRKREGESEKEGGRESEKEGGREREKEGERERQRDRETSNMVFEFISLVLTMAALLNKFFQI